MKIGFIGLGIMGSRMALHLSEAHELAVFDVDMSKTVPFRKSSVHIADSVPDVVKDAEIVFMSLPSSRIVLDVALGPNGAVHTMSPGSTLIDTSTTDPEVSREIARTLDESQIRFLDAPVSGGESGARDATLSIMVGGSPDDFNRCKPVIDLIGSSVIRVGDTGAGEVAKLVNNMIVGAAFSVVAEGFALAGKCGLDAATLYEAIRGGWAGSKVLDVAALSMIDGNYEPGGTVNLLYKDIGYALGLARSLDVPTPITAQVDEIFKASRAQGNGEKAQPVIIKLWESLEQ